MKQKKAPENAQEALDFMADSLANTGPLNINDLREELIESGIYPDKAIARVRMLVKNKQKALRLSWQKEAEAWRTAFFAHLKTTTGQLPNTVEEVKARIKELLVGLSALEPQMQASFRKLEGLSDEELKTMLEDMESLKNCAEEL